MIKKVFSKRNIALFICSMIITYGGYFLYDNHALNIATPTIMIVGYLPIMLIEKNIIELSNNKLLNAILRIHIVLTFSMTGIYFFVIAIGNIMNVW